VAARKSMTAPAGRRDGDGGHRAAEIGDTAHRPSCTVRPRRGTIVQKPQRHRSICRESASTIFSCDGVHSSAAGAFTEA
jgi:hypothetical protein